MPVWLGLSALKALPWKYIGAALAALSLALLIWRAPWAEHRQKAKDAAALSAEHAKAEGFRANQMALTAALNHQNEAVTALKSEGVKRVADGTKALQDARKANQSLTEQAAALRRSAGRKVDATPCPISETLKQAGEI
jgi:small-conductance mechanosensitive channel